MEMSAMKGWGAAVVFGIGLFILIPYGLDVALRW